MGKRTPAGICRKIDAGILEGLTNFERNFGCVLGIMKKIGINTSQFNVPGIEREDMAKGCAFEAITCGVARRFYEGYTNHLESVHPVESDYGIKINRKVATVLAQRRQLLKSNFEIDYVPSRIVKMFDFEIDFDFGY
ncbi:MAG: hypothetical protein V1888_00615 [archaeon]